MKKLVLAAAAIALLAGCSPLKRLTGQTNDTVLPGKREEVLPPDMQQARDPAITGQPEPGSSMNDNAIMQAPVSGAQPAMPGAAKAGAPPALPKKVLADCDAKVDLCPEATDSQALPQPEAKAAAGAMQHKKSVKKKTQKPVTAASPNATVPPPAPNDSALPAPAPPSGR